MTKKRYVLYNYGQIDKDEKSRYSVYKRPFNPCKEFDGTVTVYNTLKHKTQDKRIFDRNHFFDNGFGQNIQLLLPSGSFDAGDEVTYKAKNYNVLVAVGPGTNPDTNPEKFSLFGPNVLPVEKQGVISNYDSGIKQARSIDLLWEEPDSIGRGVGFSTPDQGFQSVATLGNHHSKHSMILNNQRSTTLFDPAIGVITVQPEYTDGNNASDQSFDQADELKPDPFSYVFYDESKDPVEMEYIMLHTVVAPCREGFLYLEIDKPDITEAIDSSDLTGNDHMVYFWGWGGDPDVNTLTGEQFEAGIINQLKQNQNDDIDDVIWAANDELQITAPDVSDGAEGFVGNVRLLYCCRLSDIKSIPDTKKMVVGLNVESKLGELTFVNIMIGMKASDWTFVKKVETTTSGIGTSEATYSNFTNPPVMPKITFTAEFIRIKLDEEGATIWDDRPLHPIEADSLRSMAFEDNRGFEKVFHTNRYGLFTVKDDIITTIDNEDRFGLPTDTNDEDVVGSRLIDVVTPINEFQFRPDRTPSRLMWFGNTGIVSEWSTAGNIFEIGSFALIAAKAGQYVLRLPQVFRSIKQTRNFDGGGGFLSNAALSGHTISLQRGDEFIKSIAVPANTNDIVDIDNLRSNMTKLDEWTTETFYSSPQNPSGDTGGPSFAATYTEQNKCDMHRYRNIDITEGQGIQVSGRFYFVNGKQGASGDKGGLFQADKPAGHTGSGGAFSTFFNKTWFRIISKLETGNFDDVDFPYRVDLGVVLFNVPALFDLAETPTPRANLNL